MLRVINNVTGAVLGVALICGAIWFRVVDFAVHEMLIGYMTRSTATNSPYMNDGLMLYPFMGMLIGGVLVVAIIFASSRRNKRRIKNGLATTNPIWIMTAAFVLSFAGGAAYGHYFG